MTPFVVICRAEIWVSDSSSWLGIRLSHPNLFLTPGCVCEMLTTLKEIQVCWRVSSMYKILEIYILYSILCENEKKKGKEGLKFEIWVKDGCLRT